MVVEELDQPERDRDGELPAAACLFLPLRNGTVGGVVAHEAAAATQVQSTQPHQASIKRLRAQRRREGAQADSQRETGPRVSHGNPLQTGPPKLANAVP